MSISRKRPGNDGNGAGFIRVSLKCFHMEMQTSKCDFEPLPVQLFEERESPLQNAYKPNAFEWFWVPFQGRCFKCINDRCVLYGFVTVFWRLQKYMFPQGIIRILSIAKVYHRMLVNVMSSHDSCTMPWNVLLDPKHPTWFIRSRGSVPPISQNIIS